MEAVRTDSAKVVLTLSLREAQDLVSLTAYNVTIPDAIAGQVLHAPSQARQEVRDCLDRLNTALRPIAPRAHWFSPSEPRHAPACRQESFIVQAGRFVEEDDPSDGSAVP